eukprot:2124083-Rhodomonas_salina.1
MTPTSHRQQRDTTEIRQNHDNAMRRDMTEHHPTSQRHASDTTETSHTDITHTSHSHHPSRHTDAVPPNPSSIPQTYHNPLPQSMTLPLQPHHPRSHRQTHRHRQTQTQAQTDRPAESCGRARNEERAEGAE